MKNIIAIIGGFRLPQGNAGAVRALGNAKLLQKLGYEIILIGKIQNPKEGQYWYEFDGFRCFDIECEKDQIDIGVKYFSRFLMEIGAKNLKAVIAYNYPGVALNKLFKITKKTDIVLISDTTEWYALEGKNPISALRRKFQTEYRMRCINKKIGNLICSTYYIANYYKKHNTVIIPMIDDTSFSGIKAELKKVEDCRIRRFIYAGSPGYKFKKDKINIIVEQFLKLKAENIPFILDVYGISLEEYKSQYAFEELLDESFQINFHGRVPRTEIQEKLRTTDFYVLYRPDNRVCRVGFSTKAMESISSAVPLIANDVNGDFAKYFTEGQALLSSVKDEQGFYKNLKMAAQMSAEEINQRKRSCVEHNPFAYESFLEPMKKFFKKAGMEE